MVREGNYLQQGKKKHSEEFLLSPNIKHMKEKAAETHKSKRYLNMPAQLRGELLFLYIFHSCFASEQVNCHPGRKQALVLLPFQRL